MIIIASAFLIVFVVWLVRRVVRRIRRAVGVRRPARSTIRADGAPPAEPSVPEARLRPAQPDDTADAPQGPHMWGDGPGDQRRLAGGRGRP